MYSWVLIVKGFLPHGIKYCKFELVLLLYFHRASGFHEDCFEFYPPYPIFYGIFKLITDMPYGTTYYALQRNAEGASSKKKPEHIQQTPTI